MLHQRTLTVLIISAIGLSELRVHAKDVNAKNETETTKKPHKCEESRDEVYNATVDARNCFKEFVSAQSQQDFEKKRNCSQLSDFQKKISNLVSIMSKCALVNKERLKNNSDAFLGLVNRTITQKNINATRDYIRNLKETNTYNNTIQNMNKCVITSLGANMTVPKSQYVFRLLNRMELNKKQGHDNAANIKNCISNLMKDHSEMKNLTETAFDFIDTRYKPEPHRPIPVPAPAKSNAASTVLVVVGVLIVTCIIAALYILWKRRRNARSYSNPQQD